jgi:predicted transcriptional regulator
LKRRNNLDVSVDILQACICGTNKTRMVVKSNLNFEIIKEYVSTLIYSGFLAEENGGYITTEKGAKFVEDYRNLIEPLNLNRNEAKPNKNRSI